MAKRTVHRLIDDLDGAPADETVRFGIDGAQYEIDLSAAHAADLRGALAAFAAAARRSRRLPAVPFVRGAGRASAAEPGRDRDGNRAIREWAAANGIEVPRLGRLRRDIVERYRAANGG